MNEIRQPAEGCLIGVTNVCIKKYTKHIYIGSQRVVSKLGDLGSFGPDPRRVEYAGSNTDVATIDYKAKYAAEQAIIKVRYDTLKVPYYGKNNDDYINGKGFCCSDSTAGTGGSTGGAGGGNMGNGNDNPELYQYYYHSDHLGSSSFITNLDGEVAQHIEYVPFGEVFIEEKNNNWNTPYKFNGKELDEETGLYYYGARYMDPRTSLWLSVDSKLEKYVNMSPYNYCANNPVKFVDPDGMEFIIAIKNSEGKTQKVVYNYDRNVFLDKKGNVVTNDFINKVTESFEYLRDADKAGIIKGIAEHRKKLLIEEVTDNTKTRVSSGVGGKKVLYNVKDGLIIDEINHAGGLSSTDKRQSPALGFFHELGHILLFFTNKKQFIQNLRNTDVPPYYQNYEEYRVIRDIETPAAKELREYIRDNHTGGRFDADKPTGIIGPKHIYTEKDLKIK